MSPLPRWVVSFAVVTVAICRMLCIRSTSFPCACFSQQNGETRDLEGGGEDIGYGTITSNDRRRGSSGAGPVSNTSSVGNGYGYLHSLCSGSSSDDATGASSRRPAKGQLQASTKNSKHKTRRKKRRQSRGNASSTTMPVCLCLTSLQTGCLLFPSFCGFPLLRCRAGRQGPQL